MAAASLRATRQEARWGEIGRITATPAKILGSLATSMGLQLASASFAAVAMEAVDQAWTRDPFDRLIVGQAIADKARLLTKDDAIRRHFRAAFWD